MIEPLLISFQEENVAPKKTTDDDVIIAIKAYGIWKRRFDKTNFDVKYFNHL